MLIKFLYWLENRIYDIAYYIDNFFINRRAAIRMEVFKDIQNIAETVKDPEEAKKLTEWVYRRYKGWD